MPESILVAHDGSTQAQQALSYALEIVPDGRIVLFHAIDPFAVTPDDEGLPRLTNQWRVRQRDAAADLFEEALAAVETGSVTIETATAFGSPAQTIVTAVDEYDVDGIVVGNRGLGDVSGARLGSTAELVVRRATVPVTVVR